MPTELDFDTQRVALAVLFWVHATLLHASSLCVVQRYSLHDKASPRDKKFYALCFCRHPTVCRGRAVFDTLNKLLQLPGGVSEKYLSLILSLYLFAPHRVPGANRHLLRTSRNTSRLWTP